MMISDAYAAGLVDGEGCIYLQDSKRQSRRMFYPVIEIGMTEKALAVLQAMRRRYGGQIYETREATDRWSAAVAWKAHGPVAADCLRAIQPHLQLKSEQCRMALKAQEIRDSLVPEGGRNAAWTPEASERCATLKAAIQELNRKGPPISSRPPIPGAKLAARRVGSQWVTDQGDLFSDTGWASFSGPWPTSGMGWHGEFWTHSISESPRDAVASSLSDVLETGTHLSKYFLSPKAATGILRRAAKRGRELPPQLAEALSRLSREEVDAGIASTPKEPPAAT